MIQANIVYFCRNTIHSLCRPVVCLWWVFLLPKLKEWLKECRCAFTECEICVKHHFKNISIFSCYRFFLDTCIANPVRILDPRIGFPTLQKEAIQIRALWPSDWSCCIMQSLYPRSLRFQRSTSPRPDRSRKNPRSWQRPGRWSAPRSRWSTRARKNKKIHWVADAASGKTLTKWKTLFGINGIGVRSSDISLFFNFETSRHKWFSREKRSHNTQPPRMRQFYVEIVPRFVWPWNQLRRRVFKKYF